MIIFLSIMLGLSIILVILLIRRLFIFSKEVDGLKLELEMREFSNKWISGYYKDLAVYLTNKKSRLSKEAKEDILRLYINILLFIPHEYREVLKSSFDAVDFEVDPLKMTEHKQAAIESLNTLAELEDMNVKELIALNYHICYLLLK